jgi:hypothetical protein
MTDTPRRVQRSRAKGWRMPENTVCVSRPSVFGNPFRCLVRHVECPASPSYRGPPDLKCCVQQYREWLTFGIAVHERRVADWTMRGMAGALAANRLPELRGKNLACWCRLDQPCHADVLLELANAPLRCEAG